MTFSKPVPPSSALLLIAAALFCPVAALAQASDQAAAASEARIKQLEQRVEELERLLGVVRSKVAEDEKAAAEEKAVITQKVAAVEKEPAPAETATQTNAFKVFPPEDPTSIQSGDGNFLFRFGGDIQVDVRSFPGHSLLPLTDQILLRRVRPIFSGTLFKYVDYYIRPDFGQGSTVIYDAYMQLNYFKHFTLRAGKFKPPVGLERLQSDDDTNFVERGLPTLLVPSRDIGFQIAGDFFQRKLSYQVGVFNGVPDNSLSDASPSDHRDYAGRIFLTPINTAKSTLGFGLGATGGNVDGIALPSYKTFGQNTFFTFASGVTSAGHRTRLAPQAYYYLGPAGILAEYTLAEEGFQKGTVRKDVALRAWQVQASYLLTGEKKVFGTLVPRRPFDPMNHGWGAFEIAARVSDFSVDPGMFNYGFASLATSPEHSHEWVGGISWYLNRMLRLTMDYGNTNFAGGAAASLGGNRPSERAFLQRFQISF